MDNFMDDELQEVEVNARNVEFEILATEIKSSGEDNAVILIIDPLVRSGRSSPCWEVKSAVSLKVVRSKSDRIRGMIGIYEDESYSCMTVSEDVFSELWNSVTTGTFGCVKLVLGLTKLKETDSGLEWEEDSLEIRSCAFIYRDKPEYRCRSIREAPLCFREEAVQALESVVSRIKTERTGRSLAGIYEGAIVQSIEYCVKNRIFNSCDYSSVIAKSVSVVGDIYYAIWNDGDDINSYHDDGLRPYLWYRQANTYGVINYDLNPSRELLESAASAYLSCPWLGCSQLDFILVDSLLYVELSDFKSQEKIYTQLLNQNTWWSNLLKIGLTLGKYAIIIIVLATLYDKEGSQTALLALIAYLLWSKKDKVDNVNNIYHETAFKMEMLYKHYYASDTSPSHLRAKLIECERDNVVWPAIIYSVIDAAERNGRVIGYPEKKLDD
jgi:hypothetical protein